MQELNLGYVSVFIPFLILMTFGCSTRQADPEKGPVVAATDEVHDPYLWLEEVEGEKALDWAKIQNEKYVPMLRDNGTFRMLEPEIRKIVLAKERIPMPAIRGNHVYNFWQDENHVRGIWRRTTLDEYKKADPQWEILIDLDELAKKENENWVWKFSSCLHPEVKLCLVVLSRGGKDASVYREFDVEKKSFVSDGFNLPEAKSNVSWFDENTLLVATDFGPDSMTLSGYPRQVRVWKRGAELATAPIIFEAEKNHMAAYPHVSRRPDGVYAFMIRKTSFFEEETFVVSKDLKTLTRIDLPNHFSLEGVIGGLGFGFFQKEWKGSKVFKPGTLVSFPLSKIGKLSNFLTEIYVPSGRSSLQRAVATKDKLYVAVLNNIKSELYQYTLNSREWSRRRVNLPAGGNVNVLSVDDLSNRLFVTYESYIQPTSLYLITGIKEEIYKKLPDQYDASNVVVEQFESTSKDGTKIPYSVVRPKDMALNGKNATILYGYGGFQIAMLPSYLGARGKVWVEKGNVWVTANIRGGGEFGPEWHEAALKENRQKAYDDFLSVAEDLIKRGITSPRHLGIMGGSNGGLLVGAAFTQRPDLFNGVVCQVPLLDMLRFHKLLAGHSWTGEYGNPDNPEEAKFIAKYSPYQNVKKGVKYPRVFFLTSTKDDRVHPGHARKMVARMQEYGHDVYYYENIEGGHGAAANLEQVIFMNSLAYTYFYQQLVGP